MFLCVCVADWLQAICLLVKEKLSKEALEKTAKEKGTKVRHFQGLLYKTHCCYSCKFLFLRPMFYIVSQKKMSPHYICDNLVRCHPILPILGRNIPPGKWKQTHMHSTSHVNFVFVLYLVKIHSLTMLVCQHTVTVVLLVWPTWVTNCGHRQNCPDLNRAVHGGV